MTISTGHTKECAQCDQCGQPLSAGGRQHATCVHSEIKGTAHMHARSTSHARKQSAVRSASTAAYVITSDY